MKIVKEYIINLSSKLNVLNEVRLRYNFIAFSDSVEGLSLDDDRFKLGREQLIFVVSSNTCATCVILAIEKLFENYSKFLSKFDVLLLMGDENSSLTGFIEGNGYDKFVEVLIDSNLVRKIIKEHRDSLCIYVDEKGRIIFASVLNLSNFRYLDLFYEKISRYVNK